MSANNLQRQYSLFDELPNLAYTRGGTKFNPQDEVWSWYEDVQRITLNFPSLELPNLFLTSLKLTLLQVACNSSPLHLQNLFFAFKHFWTRVKDFEGINAEIQVRHIANYFELLKETERPILSTVNGVFQKWVDLQLPGVSSDCANYLKERKKQGNDKGRLVRTRDPFHGPFSEAEYKAIYKSVDSAWGEGIIPLWLLVINRLLFACGGRISQYASLKIEDFYSQDNQFNIKLPQVKKRGLNSREILKEYPVSPQTGEVIIKYIDELYKDGFTHKDALFPEKLILDKSNLSNRSESDIFLGHCTKSALSNAFVALMSRIAPPSERLDYAPIPINPQRYRYTFGTRLAEEGASLLVIADRLGHEDGQNAGIYFEASPKIIENIDKAMDRFLAPLAEAFRGRLIKDESQSTLKGVPGSRIIDFKSSKKPLANCAGGECGFNKPVACYTCINFEPWLDGPHQEVLDRLERERTLIINDERIAKINDDAILAVRQVIAYCQMVRDQEGEVI